MSDTLIAMPPHIEAAVRDAVQAAIESLQTTLCDEKNVAWFAIAATTAGTYLTFNAVSAALPPDKRRKVAFAQLEATFVANEAPMATVQ